MIFLFIILSAAAAVVNCFLIIIFFYLVVLLVFQILWENCLVADIGCHQKITVDGTDFCIQPPNDGQPRSSWYSHKFKKPAVRYEVGISIQSGDIVWLSGPWRAGRYPDITIF